MSDGYPEAKRDRHLELIRSIDGGVAGHEEPRPGTAAPSFDGGAMRGEPRPPALPWSHNRLPPGWEWDPED